MGKREAWLMGLTVNESCWSSDKPWMDSALFWGQYKPVPFYNPFKLHGSLVDSKKPTDVVIYEISFSRSLWKKRFSRWLARWGNTKEKGKYLDTLVTFEWPLLVLLCQLIPNLQFFNFHNIKIQFYAWASEIRKENRRGTFSPELKNFSLVP